MNGSGTRARPPPHGRSMADLPLGLSTGTFAAEYPASPGAACFEALLPITLFDRKRQPLAAYRFGGLECMLLGPGEGGLMSMIG